MMNGVISYYVPQQNACSIYKIQEPQVNPYYLSPIDRKKSSWQTMIDEILQVESYSVYRIAKELWTGPAEAKVSWTGRRGAGTGGRWRGAGTRERW